MPNFIKRLIASNREFILNEVVEVKGLMQLLMKHQNTGQEWTKEEKKEIKVHLKKYIKGCSSNSHLLNPRRLIASALPCRSA